MGGHKSDFQNTGPDTSGQTPQQHANTHVHTHLHTTWHSIPFHHSVSLAGLMGTTSQTWSSQLPHKMACLLSLLTLPAGRCRSVNNNKQIVAFPLKIFIQTELFKSFSIHNQDMYYFEHPRFIIYLVTDLVDNSSTLYNSFSSNDHQINFLHYKSVKKTFLRATYWGHAMSDVTKHKLSGSTKLVSWKINWLG